MAGPFHIRLIDAEFVADLVGDLRLQCGVSRIAISTLALELAGFASADFSVAAVPTADDTAPKAILDNQLGQLVDHFLVNRVNGKIAVRIGEQQVKLDKHVKDLHEVRMAS
jgi:hypothetical protein